jgi:hypothetical protein
MPPRDKASYLDEITERGALSDLFHLGMTYHVEAEPGWDSPHDPSELLRLEVAA